MFGADNSTIDVKSIIKQFIKLLIYQEIKWYLIFTIILKCLSLKLFNFVFNISVGFPQFVCNFK